MPDTSDFNFEFPDDTSMPDELRVRALLEEMMETGSSPEQVSGGDLKLERALRERLRRARDVEAQLEEMFPTPYMGEDSTRRALREGLRKEGRLPEIPGYEVSSIIGTGGMGVVYRARHLKLDRWVAIKMVLLGAYASREEMECLLREAQDVAALHHPNIVQVYDVAEHDGFPYFAMELLDGGDLSRTLQGKPRAPREAADLIRVLAGAVHAAHLGGIVHRDLKPGNIFLCSDGTPKIGDFSLARRLEHDSTIMTHARQVGTPSYMAPEQAAGDSRAIRPSVDIYALGAMLYELLTGRPPFKAESSTETRRQVITDEPVPPARLNSRVPRDLETICLKCLLKDPARRYETAADLADDLERFANGKPILARPVGAGERMVKWCRRRPSMALAVGVSVVAMAGAVAGGIWLQQVEHARQTQETVRRESARNAIESELPLLERLVRSRQWAEAAGVLSTSRSQLKDAESPELASRLASVAKRFEVARELDRIRQSFPDPAAVGYTFVPARDAYARVFTQVGIGHDVDPATAAARVRASPLRDVLLPALDHAAFTELFSGSMAELRRLLAVAQAGASDPWQDRFHDFATWQDLTSLQQLVRDAPTAVPAPPVHQLVIVGLLLSNLGSNDATIEILRDAQMRDPADFWVNLELGNAIGRADRPQEAIQFFRAAVSLRPMHYTAWTTLGGTLIRGGASEEAIGPLRRAVALQPDYSTSWESLVIALGNCGRWGEAQQAIREAIATISDDAGDARIAAYQDWVSFGQARSMVRRRDWQNAAENYAQAVAGRYASEGELWFELAAVQLLAGDMAAYSDVCRSMLERWEPLGLRRFLVARACTLAVMREDELALASQIVRDEIERFPESRWALTARGALLCRQGRHIEAVGSFEKSIQADVHPAKAVINWVWLARAHLSLGDPDTAKIWLAKAAEWLDQRDTKPEGIHLHDWLEAQILRREVETELTP